MSDLSNPDPAPQSKTPETIPDLLDEVEKHLADFRRQERFRTFNTTSEWPIEFAK